MGGCASAFQSLSRDDAEGGPPFETVDAEVFAVSGKDDGGPKILCKYDERRVGNVHGEIRVLFEKTTSAFQRRRCGWHEDGSSLEKETDRSRRTAVNRPEEVGGFRDVQRGLVRRTRVSQSDGERAPPAAQLPVLRVGATAAVRA